MNDDYGLPDVEMKPIDRAKPVVPTAAAPVVTPKKRKGKGNEKKEESNYWQAILIALFISLIAGGAIYYFLLRSPEGGKATNELTNDTTPPDRLPLDENEVNDTGGETDASVNTNEVTANLDQPGTITSISERTGRYYIFLGSYKFRAYAQRHAKQLANDGFAVKVIDQDDWVGLRVAVGNYGSEGEAQADATAISSKYGTKIAISQY